ncbi:MAG: hypothetical protein HZA27_00715 [Candidatus Omnitrophica bacterium]|nr:hypothetical protein [Candidatus Omnitrophota bacterium]
MSIIYDALKKVEFSLKEAAGPSLEPGAKVKKVKPKPYLIYILLASLVFFVANTLFIFFRRAAPTNSTVNPLPSQSLPVQQVVNQTSETTPEATLIPAPETLPVVAAEKEDLKEKLVLNGIFFSNEQVYALINNQIVREGDTIEGAKVVRITSDEVELASEEENIKLSTRR